MTSKIGPAEREQVRKLRLKEKANEENLIPHKNCVKYLGVNIDEKLNYKQHIEIQLSKASKAFWNTKRLFYSRLLDSKVKIMCYQTLIRPIITYGCPIWYNIPASLMEKIRIFERKCIRACLSIYGSEHSGYRKYVKNKKIRLSQHAPHRLSHPKTNKKPLRASREDQRKQPNLRLLIPKRRILQKHSANRLHPPRSLSIPRRKKQSPRPKQYPHNLSYAKENRNEIYTIRGKPRWPYCRH